jgi:hypothetical protein
MSDLVLPPGLLISKWTFGQNTYNLPFGNPASGAEQVTVLGPSRWTCTFGSHFDLKPAQSALWSVLQVSLRGRVNRLKVHDVANPVPLGTLRGAIALASAVAAGSNTATLTASGQGGKTLLAGDWLQVGAGNTGQLVKVIANAAADGAGTIAITFEPTLRYAQTSSTPVTWDKPSAFFRRTDASSQWEAQGPVQGNFQMALIESWEA